MPDNSHLPRRAQAQGGPTAAANPDQLTYDGSNQPQERALTARERDILTRVLGDIAHAVRREDTRTALLRLVRLYGDDPRTLAELRIVLDPRDDT